MGFVAAFLAFVVCRPNTVLNCLNFLFSTYSNDQSAFFETQVLEWAKVLRENHAGIREEYEAFCRTHYRPKVAELIPSEQPSIAGRPSSTWRVVYLRHYLQDSEAVIRKEFPLTMSLLKQSNCVSAFFSVLEPNVELLPHMGYYKGVLRYHLALIVPPAGKSLTGSPHCYLEVDGTKFEWEVGKDVMFDDCRLHSAYNRSTTDRVVLLLDIKRPLPFVLNAINHAAIALARFVPKASGLVKRVNRYQAGCAKTGP